MPPWSTNTDYCNLVQGQYSLRLSDPKGSAGWTSDNAFCLGPVGDGWQIILYIALAFWGFFTVVNLIAMFDLRKMGGGETVAGTVKTLAVQVAGLVAVCASFFLLLVAHRALYLLAQALAGGNLNGRVDALWDSNHALAVLHSTQDAFDNRGDNIWKWIIAHVGVIFGDNLPGDDTVGSFTWALVRSALDETDTIMVQGVGAIRFVVMAILVITAPLAWMSALSAQTRDAFELWLKEWLYLEGMALLTALTLTAYNHLVCGSDTTCTGNHRGSMGESQYAFMMLAFTALTSGPMLAYMWRLIGAILNFGAGAFQARYTRIRGGINMALDGLKLIGDAIPGPVGEVMANVGETGRTLSNIIPGAPFTTGSNLPDDGDRGWLERRELKKSSGDDGGDGTQTPASPGGPQNPGGPRGGPQASAFAPNQAAPQTAVNISNAPNSAIQVNVQQLVQQASTSQATSASWGTGTAGEGAAGSSAAAGAAAGDAAEVAVVAAL